MNRLIRGSLGLLLALPLAVGAASRPAAPFTDAEIDQMLAPIALYPDAVLSHVLIAATVPEDVEEAAEWSRRHPDLRGQAAVDAVERKNWDPSVKALVAFPEVLERMDEDPEWTDNLGEAFLEQEAVVMDRVQVLRDHADEAGNLDSVEHVRVVREREYIYLEPAVQHVLYVPYYDPWYVYGSWWWASYPPHRWTYWAGRPARYYYGSTFYWGFGFHLAPTYYYGRFNWPARHVVVTRPHRHYAPSPGYSGHSSMRRPHTDARYSRQHVERRHDNRRGNEWRHDNRRSAERRHDNRRPDPPRREYDRRTRRAPEARQEHHRRSSTEIRQELSVRREARAHDQSRGRSQDRRQDWHRESRGDSREWGQARSEARAQSRPDRGEHVVERRRDEGANRGPGRPAHQERDHGRREAGREAGGERNRGVERHQGQRQHGRARSER